MVCSDDPSTLSFDLTMMMMMVLEMITSRSSHRDRSNRAFESYDS